MPLLVATQVTAVATAVLALFAILSALFAYLAFGSQSAEVRLLQQERVREAAERRRVQASKIFLWERREKTVARPPKHEVTAQVRNSSEQPIYDVRYIWRVPNGKDVLIARRRPLMPGETASSTVPVPQGVNPPSFGAHVVFRDAAGVRWRVQPDGVLGDLPDDPFWGAIDVAGSPWGITAADA